MKASLFDFSFAAIDSKDRNMTFSFIMRLKREVSTQTLLQGAKAAFESYPLSNCRLKGYHWEEDTSSFDIEILKSKEDISPFVNEFLNIEEERGLKQALFSTPEEKILITKFHHALCDGIAAFLWLETQLSSQKKAAFPLQLKTFEKGARKSKYSFSVKSDGFGHKSERIGSLRSWQTIEIDRPQFLFNKSLTYNDFLAAVLLKSMETWNQKHEQDVKNISLYIPVNIRERPFEGFGNGASRIKVYASKNPSLPIMDYSKYVREQVRWCKEKGLWAAPDLMKLLSRLPVKISRSFLNFLPKLPSSDFCSLLFSHMERHEGLLHFQKEITSLEIVAPLIKAYSVAVVATSEGMKTRITVTWDASYLEEDKLKDFLRIFESQYESGAEELGRLSKSPCSENAPS